MVRSINVAGTKVFKVHFDQHIFLAVKPVRGSRVLIKADCSGSELRTQVFGVQLIAGWSRGSQAPERLIQLFWFRPGHRCSFRNGPVI